jgi:ankyrin repeat protein
VQPKWHPLHSYALALQIPLMDSLLDSGVDINLLDKDGFTPLHKAVIGKKEAVISHLLRRGANPHVRDRVTLQGCNLFL